MPIVTRFPALALAATMLMGFGIGAWVQPWSAATAQARSRVFEIRTYTAQDGKLPDLQARFRNHTVALFKKHGLENVGYWVPTDPPLSQNTLIYVLAHPSRDEAKRNWDAFRNDPDWKKVRAESEANGPVVSKVESVFVSPTDYSPIK
jgi:hypothetical protein